MTWFACHQPERPTDPFVRWHYGHCTPCHIKALMVQHQYPDDTHVQWVVDMTAPS